MTSGAPARRDPAKRNASSASAARGTSTWTSEIRRSRIASSRRLSDGMSPSSSGRRARRSAREVTARAYRHNRRVNHHEFSTNGVEPERGLVLAVFPRNADVDDELAETREL